MTTKQQYPRQHMTQCMNKTQWHSTDRTMSDHASYTSLSSPSTSRPPQLRSHLAWPWHPCWGPRGHHYKTWPHHGDCCLWVCAAGPSVLHHPVNGKQWEETEPWYGTQHWFYVSIIIIKKIINKNKNSFKVLFFNLSSTHCAAQATDDKKHINIQNLMYSSLP